ncbi:hypothetical protein AVEN_61955-1 [Araneus ventricosus]|uniref:Uncharacterized protein n=1 Tax=Araneus ventricosus TaxID=182803 RepID=A0A4Y2MPI7_ARAVE|nr:hypothetical protein AVEN_61955-1 [Araneus ventricosus]
MQNIQLSTTTTITTWELPNFKTTTWKSTIAMASLYEPIISMEIQLHITLKQHEVYFGTELVTFNHGQMTRKTPKVPRFHATPSGGRSATTYDLACDRCIHGGSSVESGFEPGALRPQSRDLATRPPWPP